MRGFVIREIARHQRTALLSHRAFVLSWALLYATFFATLLSGWNDYTAARLRNDEAERNDRLRWLNQGRKQPHIAGDQGVLVFLRIPQLAALDPGILPYTGSTAALAGEHEEILNNKPAEGTHSLHRLGSLSAASVLQVLMPLMLALQLHATVAGERDHGTLSQALACGVSPSECITGKLAGIALVLCLMMAPVAAATAIVMRHSLAEFGILAGLYVVYLFTIVVLITAVSARAATGRQSLVILLCAWALGFVAAPVIITDLAQVFRPSPSSLEYAAAQMEADRKMPTVEERRAAVRVHLLRQYGVQSLRDLPVDPIGVELSLDEADSEVLYGRLVEQVYDSYEEQNRWYRIGAIVSPLPAIQSLSMAVSRTDFDAYRDFTRAGERYRRAMITTLNNAIMHNPAYRTAPVFPGTDIIVTDAGPELWRSIPEFSYEPAGITTILARSRTALALLLGWMTFAAVLLFDSVRRLSPK
jgi:ABC-2 type transport system permease protein